MVEMGEREGSDEHAGDEAELREEDVMLEDRLDDRVEEDEDALGDGG